MYHRAGATGFEKSHDFRRCRGGRPRAAQTKALAVWGVALQVHLARPSATPDGARNQYGVPGQVESPNAFLRPGTGSSILRLASEGRPPPACRPSLLAALCGADSYVAFRPLA